MIANLFSIQSKNYAQFRPTYPDDLFDFIQKSAAHHQTVWDCATGSGQAARKLKDIFQNVYATDISQEQIKHAIQSGNINYSVQPSEKTNFQDNFFDCITVAQALHWFDHSLFWKEVNRVLKPNGLFIGWGYSFFHMNEEINPFFEEDILKTVGAYWPPQVKILWNGFKDINFPYKELDTPDLFIHLNWDFYQFQNYIKTWSSTKKYIQEYGTDDFMRKFDRIKKCWNGLDKKKIFKMRLFILSGYKTN